MKVYLAIDHFIKDDYSFKENLGIFTTEQNALDCVTKCFYRLYNRRHLFRIRVDGFNLVIDSHGEFSNVDVHCVHSFSIETFNLDGDCILSEHGVNLNDILNNEKAA